MSGAAPHPFSLRDWITLCTERGEIRTISGAHWDLEIGALTEMVHARRNAPALMFNTIPGYPENYQVLTNSLGSINRVALATGLPWGLEQRDFMEQWRMKLRQLSPVDPRFIETPGWEVSLLGEAIDLFSFPSPKWHEEDGGRYLGTAAVTITRDPETRSCNVGCYRVMVKDRTHLALFIAGGKGGFIHREKFFARGEPCPVAISFGHHPLVFLVGTLLPPEGLSEYSYAGAIMGAPLPVVRGPLTGLPIPADTELCIEGEFIPGEKGSEGPFGEWTGYYASWAREEPLARVKAVYHKKDPIILGSPPSRPPSETTWARNLLRSVELEDQLAAMGIPDIQSAWFHPAGGSRFLLIVSIKQRYPGHSRQTGIAASQCSIGAFMGRIVVVVDEDIDVTDLNEVMWAVCTRCDPVNGIQILRESWSSVMDPVLPPGSAERNSRIVIDACRPYEWREKFPKVSSAPRALREEMQRKWRHLLGDLFI
ncbi:MAG: UbiD family decarboxylase [Candidatus Binatia bacterium]